jgi:DNA-binding Lrp family transcriptional regulator
VEDDKNRRRFGAAPQLGGLDRIDSQILAELQQNARLPNKTLAARVHLSESSCLARVRRLRERGIITGFHAHTDPARLGRPLQALIAIRYRHTQRSRVERFTHDMLALAETLSLFHVTGDDDFLLHVAVTDTNELRGFVLDRLLRRPEVDHVRTSIIYEHHPKGVLQGPAAPQEQPATDRPRQ